MPSKRDYEKTFNDLLGTTVQWSNLTKEDLVQLATLFGKPKTFLKTLGLEAAEDQAVPKFRQMLAEVFLNEDKGGPLIKAIRDLVDQKT